MSDGPKYEVGYKKPPKESRYTKGNSGNPKGRPADTKDGTFQDVVEKELKSKISVTMGARRRKITISEAITKAQIQKALKGDSTSFALLAKGSERRDSIRKDSLSPIVEALRSIHAKHEAGEGKPLEPQPPANDEE